MRFRIGHWLIFSLSNLVLIWSTLDVVSHTSGEPVIFGLYSPKYFVVVVAFVAFNLLWLILSGFVLLAPAQFNALEHSLLKRIGTNSWLIWVSVGPVLTITLVVALILKTPHILEMIVPATVPVTIVFFCGLYVCFRLAQYLSEDHVTQEHVPKIAPPVHIHRTVPWITITVVVLLLYGPALLSPHKQLGSSDLRALHYIVETLAREALLSRHLPLWNPFMFSGMPGLAHPVMMFFYPPQFIVRLLLPYNLGLALNMALHGWLSGAGTYLVLKRLNSRSWIALLGALTFMASGEVATRVFAGHIWLLYAMAWLPIAWYLLVNVLEEGKTRHIALLALVIALMILSGHPAFSGYGLIFLGLYWLYDAVSRIDDARSLHRQEASTSGERGVASAGRSPDEVMSKPVHEGTKSRRSPRFGWKSEILRACHLLKPALITGGRFALACALAAGLAAIQLVPSLVLAKETTLSQGYSENQLVGDTIWFEDLRMIFLPDAYPPRHSSVWELIPYLGVLPVLAAPFALGHSKHQRLAGFLWGISVLSIVLALGDELRVINLLYTLVPPFRVIRVPGRATLMAIPALVALCSLGLEAIVQRTIKADLLKHVLHLYRLAALIPVGILVGYLTNHLAGGITVSSLLLRTLSTALILGITFTLFVWRAGAFVVPKLDVMRGRWLELTLFAVSVANGLILLPELIPTKTPVLPMLLPGGLLKLAALLIVVPFLLWALYQGRHSYTFVGGILIVLVVDLASYDIRYLRLVDQFGINADQHELEHVLSDIGEGRAMLSFVPFGYNDLSLMHLGSIDGYSSGMLARYQQYLRGVAENPPTDTVVLLDNRDFPRLDERALDFLNVTYVISGYPLANTSLEMVDTREGYTIYRNPDALPRATWVHQIQAVDDREHALVAVMAPGFSCTDTVVVESRTHFYAGDSAAEPATITMTEYQLFSGYISLSVDAVQQGVLVLSEPYYPERHAFVDNKEVSVLIANVAFTAIEVPAGHHVVEIRYVPTSLMAGAWISGVTIVVLIGLGFPKRMGSAAVDLDQPGQ